MNITHLEAALDSSTIDRIRYDGKELRLFVRFHNGITYAYAKVDPILVLQLLLADSAGKFFIANIRDSHAVVKLP